jgi:hypothetical protein
MRSRLRKNYSIILSFLTFIFLIPFSRLDFDYHHDGYMLAQIIGIANGYEIHKEIFAQYGPVSPLVYSAFLLLPLSPALSIRIGCVFLISIIVFLISDLGRKRISGFPISYKGTSLAAFIWILVCDAWWGVTILPWPSVISLLLSIFGFYSLHRSYYYLNEKKFNICKLWIYISGFSFGIILFTRIQVGIILMLLFLSIPAVFRRLEVKELSIITRLIFSMICTVFGSLIILHTNGLLTDFIYQVIIFPINFYDPSLNVLQKIYDFKNVTISLSIFTIVFLISKLFRLKKYILSIICMFLFVLLISFLNFNMSSYFETALISKRQVEILVFYFMIILSVFKFFSSILLNSRNSNLQNLFLYIISFISLGSISQAIPINDSRHLWWSAPFIIILIVYLIESKYLKYNSLFATIIVMILIFNVSFGVLHLQKPRALATKPLIVRGMYLDEGKLRELNSDWDLVNKYMDQYEKPAYLAHNGGVSVITGEYNSISPYFVSWSPKLNYSTILNRSDIIFVEQYWIETHEDLFNNLFSNLKTKKRLIDSNERIKVYISE